MKIRVNPFDKKSIDDAIKQIKQYEKEFAVKEKEFARRLAEIGVRVASSGFATADYDGVNDVVVTLVQTSSGAAVVASGETVGFIEFGTGVKNPEWDNTDMEYTPPKHGTYGKGRGKNPNSWYFTMSPGARAIHTYGNAPAEAMRTARDVMIEQAIQIAREVWR
jgi:hypothetical protein